MFLLEFSAFFFFFDCILHLFEVQQVTVVFIAVKNKTANTATSMALLLFHSVVTEFVQRKIKTSLYCT